jgi:hypothetical protein
MEKESFEKGIATLGETIDLILQLAYNSRIAQETPGNETRAWCVLDEIVLDELIEIEHLKILMEIDLAMMEHREGNH